MASEAAVLGQPAIAVVGGVGGRGAGRDDEGLDRDVVGADDGGEGDVDPGVLQRGQGW